MSTVGVTPGQSLNAGSISTGQLITRRQRTTPIPTATALTYILRPAGAIQPGRTSTAAAGTNESACVSCPRREQTPAPSLYGAAVYYAVANIYTHGPLVTTPRRPAQSLHGSALLVGR